MQYFCILDKKALSENFAIKNEALLLAEGPAETTWGLYECFFPRGYKFSEDIDSGIYRVPIELSTLLYAAKGYPPALALTRHKILRILQPKQKISIEDFLSLYKHVITYYLRLQPLYQFILAETYNKNASHLAPEGFYWVIGYDTVKSIVNWVSEDYFIYENPISDFILTSEKIHHLIDEPKKLLNAEII